MKRSKKGFALLLILVMSIAVLGSCTGKPSDTESPSKPTDVSNSSDPGAASGTEGTDTDPLGEGFADYPIKDEDAELTIWTSGLEYHSDYTSEGESPYHQYLSEFTGVNLKWERPAAGEDGNQAYNLMLASNQLPDIIYTGGLPNKADTLLSEDYIITLDDYMPKYAPSLYAYLEAHPDTLRAVKSDDGKLYSFPFLREDVLWQGSYVGNVINTDCLKQIGREMPVTMQEWEDTFYGLKDVCDIVFSTNAAERLKYLFANAYGIGVDNYYVDDNKVKASFSGENYYEFIKKMNQFYKDGLIDPDFATADTEGFSATFFASRVGVATTGTVTFGYIYDQVVKRDGAWDYEPISFPVAKKGDPILYIQCESLWQGQGAMITTACDNIELACRFLDYGYTEDGIITWNFGKEGESFGYVGGVPKLLPVITEAEEGVSSAAERYTSMTANGISIMSLEFNKQRNLGFANEVADVCTANAEDALLHKMPPISTTDAESKEMADLQSTIDTYVDEMYIGFIIGSESLDQYDAYQSNLESMRLERLLQIKQEQLDRYNAR